MKLEQTQIQQVTRWVEEGLRLSEIQGKLASEFGLRVTYMEARFLLDDLGLKPKEKEPPAAAAPIVSAGATAKPEASTGAPTPDSLRPKSAAGAPGGISVSVDKVARPGTVASGNVTFSGGQTAQWQLDQVGRLGLAGTPKNYRPSEEDVMAFQTELQNELAKLGFA